MSPFALALAKRGIAPHAIVNGDNHLLRS